MRLELGWKHAWMGTWAGGEAGWGGVHRGQL